MLKWLRSLLTTDSPQTAASAEDSKQGLNAGDIGFAVGAGGGTIVDAAQLQYVLSCVAPAGEEPTPDQIGRAVGMLGGTVSGAAVLEALKKRRVGDSGS